MLDMCGFENKYHLIFFSFYKPFFKTQNQKHFLKKLWGKRGVGLIWWEKCPWNGTNSHQSYGYGYLNRPSLNTSQNPTSSAPPNQKLPAVPAVRRWT
jgi:hypothetical protein